MNVIGGSLLQSQCLVQRNGKKLGELRARVSLCVQERERERVRDREYLM